MKEILKILNRELKDLSDLEKDYKKEIDILYKERVLLKREVTDLKQEKDVLMKTITDLTEGI